MSHLTGIVNGSIGFKGTSYNPEMNGDVTLANGGMRLDYMGCNYTIPSARVHVDNHRIDLGRVLIYDSKNRPATLTGYFSHNLFKNMGMHLKVRSEKIETMNLTLNDKSLFYGDLVAGMDSLTLNGPFNDIRMNV
jgi:autotransporter translocation and assembly factor TamB